MNNLITNYNFIPFAHRGGTDFAPENTFEAFEAAVDIGYKFLETDVHPNADGQLMAFHDQTLDRVTDFSGNIQNLTSIELYDIKVKDKYRIPFLEELLENFPDCFFSVDMKCDESVDPLINLVKDMKAIDRVCFASFNQKRLNFVRDYFGNKCITSMGPNEILLTKVSSFINLKQKINSNIASLPTSRYKIKFLNERNIHYLRSLKIKVIAWTINNEKEIRDLIDMGVNGIMTDKISLLKSILIEKKVW